MKIKIINFLDYFLVVYLGLLLGRIIIFLITNNSVELTLFNMWNFIIALGVAGFLVLYGCIYNMRINIRRIIKKHNLLIDDVSDLIKHINEFIHEHNSLEKRFNEFISEDSLVEIFYKGKRVDLIYKKE